MKKQSKLERLIELAETVINSADDTGCDGDLTVVSKESVDQLHDFIVNFCEK